MTAIKKITLNISISKIKLNLLEVKLISSKSTITQKGETIIKHKNNIKTINIKIRFIIGSGP